MLQARRRKQQAIAGKIGHDEYQYKLTDEQRKIDGPVSAPPRNLVVDTPAAVSREPYEGRAYLVPLEPNMPNPSGGWNDVAHLPPARYEPPRQSMVSAFRPVVTPHLSTPTDLPQPLPSVFKQRPPLLFHGHNEGVEFVPSDGIPAPHVIRMSPVQRNPPDSSHTAPRRWAERPDNVEEMAPPAAPTPRGRSVNTIGGTLFPGTDSALSEADIATQAKAEARRRALELQRENERQVEEKRRRVEAEREMEREEQRREEERVRREREVVARRERQEVEREDQEREAKMFGPRGAHGGTDPGAAPPQKPTEPLGGVQRTAPVEGKQQLHHGNINHSGSSVMPHSQGEQPSRPTIHTPPGMPHVFSTTSSTNPAVASPSDGNQLPPWLLHPQQPTVSGEMFTASPLPQLSKPSFAAPRGETPHSSGDVLQQSAAQTFNYEAGILKREIQQVAENQRRIEHLLEDQLRVTYSTAAGTTGMTANTPPGIRGSLPGLPSVVHGGAGTYLSTGRPSPVSSFARPPGSEIYTQKSSDVMWQEPKGHLSGFDSPSVPEGKSTFSSHSPGGNIDPMGTNLAVSQHFVDGGRRASDNLKPQGDNTHHVALIHEDLIELSAEPSKFIGPVGVKMP